MSLFRKDPAAALARSEADLAKISAVVVEHKSKRQQLLLEADDLATVANIDAAIIANERAIIVCKERIEALTAAAHIAARERQEADRQAAITNTIAGRLEKVEKLATDVERYFTRYCDSHTALLAAVREVNESWPAAVPRMRHAYYFNIDEIFRRLGTAMERGRHGPAYAAKIAEGIGETVRNAAAFWLGELRKVPLPDTAPDKEAAA